MAPGKPEIRLVKTEREHFPAKSPTSATARHVFYVERLFHKYRADLAAYVCRMLPGDQQDVEAVLQNTYAIVMRQSRCSLLQPDPRPYLYAVATTIVRRELRNRLRTNPHLRRSTLTHNAWQASLTLIKTGLLELEAEPCQVFLLCRFGEFTYSEVAEKTDSGIEGVEEDMGLVFQALLQKLGTPLVPPSVAARAASWFAKKGGIRPDSAETATLATWLTASPIHQLAYELCANLWVMTAVLSTDTDVRREHNALNRYQSPRRDWLRQGFGVLLETLERR